MKHTDNYRAAYSRLLRGIPRGVFIIALTCTAMHIMQRVVASSPVRTVLLGPDRNHVLVQDPLSFLFAIHGIGLSLGFFWTSVTYMFLHGSWIHLILNMIGLYVFGKGVTREAGEGALWGIFISSGIVGGVGWALSSGLDSAVPCMGASAGVLGLAGAYATLRPRDRFVIFLPFPIVLPAWVLAIGLLVLNALELIFVESQVAYLAHLLGIVVGIVAGFIIMKFKWGNNYGG